MLKFVRDVMHAGDAMPLARGRHAHVGGDRRDDAKGFGCVGITDADGQLVGIITDGDLRRHMRPDLLDARGRGR